MSSKALKVLALAAALFGAISGARAAVLPAIEIGAETSVPYGWLDFCQRNAAECDDEERFAVNIPLTTAAMKGIEAINALVNKRVEAVSDSDHFGVPDQWDIPTDGKGDCEDFALLKRKLLIEAGFPRQALLMTVVKEKTGDGHAVLMVKTDRGDYVLDNLTNAMLPWSKTGYRFVKRQSQERQNVWIALGAPTAEPATVSRDGLRD